MVNEAAHGLVLRMTRTLPATRASVYGMLSDPRELVRWWGPRGFTAHVERFDLRVGGGFRIAMQPPDADRFHLSAAFRRVDPPARLAFTFGWHPPHPDDRLTLADLSLRDDGGRTELLLAHGTFATGERLRLHEQGWGESFDRLEELCS